MEKNSYELRVSGSEMQVASYGLQDASNAMRYALCALHI
jgi:hypothetical protein